MRFSMPNIDSYKDAPDPLVPGDYVWTCRQCLTETSKDGKPYFKLEGTIESGPVARDKAGNLVEFAGRAFTTVVWPPHPSDEQKYRERAEMTIKQLLTAADIPWDDDGFDTDDFVGVRVGLVLGPQYKKPEYMEVKRYFAV